MHIHSYVNEAGQQRHILFDDEEKVVELPTLFAQIGAGRILNSKRTVKEYLKILKLFCAYLHQRTIGQAVTVDEALTIVNAAVIEDWLVTMQALSSDTLRLRDGVLKKFMTWLTTQGAGRVRSASTHPYCNGEFKTVAPRRSAPRFLTYQEIADFIRDGFHNESERCLLHFLFESGARVSEVLRVRRADLPDLAAYPVTTMYFPMLIRGSKGRGNMIKERFAIICRPLIERLYRLHNNWWEYQRAQKTFAPSEIPAFLNVQGKRLTTGGIQRQLGTASKRLRAAGKLFKRVTAHSFRHSMALSILRSEHGRDILENLVICQRALGHASIRTTERYTMIPAPFLMELRQSTNGQESWKRFHESEYIYEQTFKLQKNHTERRGHGRRLPRRLSK